MAYNKERVKEQLSLEDIYNILEYFDAEPQLFSTYIVARTICHEGHTHKLYYYENTSLFRCYSGECGIFDIFELVQKVGDIEDLNQAVYFIVNFFNLQHYLEDDDDTFVDTEWRKLYNRYQKIKNIKVNRDKVVLEEIPNYIQYYPTPVILPWVRDHIEPEVATAMGICYDPINGAILIPHRDENNRLVGIRQRTLLQEQEVFGKYRPAYLNGKLCNHPLAFNLYGLYQAKQGIRGLETAIVFESEKAVMQYISYFGLKNDIAVAVCGSSISKYQYNLLIEAGAKEIAIAFDRDFQDYQDEECAATERKLKKIHQKFYGGPAKISFIYDNLDLLGYKCSPTDCGKEAFLSLWRNRVFL